MPVMQKNHGRSLPGVFGGMPGITQSPFHADSRGARAHSGKLLDLHDGGMAAWHKVAHFCSPIRSERSTIKRKRGCESAPTLASAFDLRQKSNHGLKARFSRKFIPKNKTKCLQFASFSPVRASCFSKIIHPDYFADYFC
jgi:hypothetical protein